MDFKIFHFVMSTFNKAYQKKSILREKVDNKFALFKVN